MKKLLSLLALVLVVSPALANVVSYTAPADQAVWGLDFDAPLGSTGTILLYLEDGSTVSGSWSYTGHFPTTAEVELGDDSSTYSYWIPVPTSLKTSIWNGDNSSYAREIKFGYGQNRGLWNDVLVTSISRSPTIGYQISSSATIEVENELKDREDAQAQLSAGDPYEGSILDILFEQLDTIMAIFYSTIWWMKFLFVDNLMLTVSLYFSGSMAYAMLTSRNIFVFYKVWFRQQRALFEFIVNMSSQILSLVAQVGGLAISGASTLLGKIAAFFV